ncbi:MAG: SDR family oxidoreductase [Pirellulaceae bacterium]|nr:SDR family oxidoreductase [Pirellulaceae bacterium]
MSNSAGESGQTAGNGGSASGISLSLAGRVALVTGNSTGLGKAIGLTLGRAGAIVPINYFNNDTRARQAMAEYEAAGIQTMLVKADVTKPDDVNDMIQQIETRFGSVDILVPNATCEQPQRPIEEYDWEFYQSMIDFFLKSPYLLTRRTLPAMKDQRFGRIINITSEVFHRAVSPFSAYVAAKGAQIGWSRSMSQELAPFGITVNMVAPGWIPVERHLHDPEEQKQGYFSMIPAQRWGVPDDVANAVLYLASEQAGFVTGQTVAVNGGMTAWM